MTNQIITSLLDTDLYKFTTSAFAFAKYRDKIATFSFKCRNEDVDLRPYADRIREQIHALTNIRLLAHEAKYLRKLGLFSEEYLTALENFDFAKNRAEIIVDGSGDELKIEVHGVWWETTFYEIPILAIVNEIYMTDPIRNGNSGAFDTGMERLKAKHREIYLNIPLRYRVPFRWTEFGTRRRFSKQWQETVVDFFINGEGSSLYMKGTSNVKIACENNIECVGTMPHEYLQAFQALSPLKVFQQVALDEWILFWRGKCGIALTDVITTDAFLRDFDLFLSKAYDGVRHDSGDPEKWGNKMLRHYEKLGIDTRTRTLVFSDGLDFRKAIGLFDKFNNHINCSFGIGTNVTNDLGIKPINIVMKLTALNGLPVAKISDSPGKTLCKNIEFLDALKKAQEII